MNCDNNLADEQLGKATKENFFVIELVRMKRDVFYN